MLIEGLLLLLFLGHPQGVGIASIWSNIYVKDIAKTKTTIKNPFLIKLLEEKGMNNNHVLPLYIREKDGPSVQHLDFLTDNRTFLKHIVKLTKWIHYLSGAC